MTTQGALAGLRVLDLADELGVYTGKLLADLGADVICVYRRSTAASRAPRPACSTGG
jgi:crotonobetainyl-CoA:carnitine CoA-transferase CaiB-like acyl-CoA transferase